MIKRRVFSKLMFDGDTLIDQETRIYEENCVAGHELDECDVYSTFIYS